MITVIDWVVGRFRGVLYTLFGAVGLLLRDCVLQRREHAPGPRDGA